MDTKSKNSRPWATWLSFFLGVNVIAVLLLINLAVLVHSGGDVRELRIPFSHDYKDSIAFKERTSDYFRPLLSLVAATSIDSNQRQMTENMLNDEGLNLKYYATNPDTGLVIKNIDDNLLSASGFPILPAAYDYYWYFDGHKIWVMDKGHPVDVERLDSGYQGLIPNLSIFTDRPDQLASSRVWLAVREPLEKNPYGRSMYYWEQRFLSVMGWICIALGVLGMALLIYALTRLRDKRAADRILASWSGKLWLEVKIVLSFIVLGFLAAGLSHNPWNWSDPATGVLTAIFVSCLVLFGCWWFYLLLIDLISNGKSFFTHNSVSSLLAWYRSYENQYSWQQAMLKRAYLLLAAEAVLALTSIGLLLSDPDKLLVAILIAGAGIYLIYRYLRRYNQTVSDLGRLIDHIELIKNGDMKTRLQVAADADLHRAAQNLNSIQEGMSIALAERMKSERMKMELITNVSHDLKTPLTSIISYVELLAKEEGLPAHVNDYITILAQKSERLKTLIQDLFDLSKASSDSIALDMKKIDLARLIRQTLADMEEQINASGLTFRLNIPDEPVFIVSDGKKLYRVWENLISNALKYSLPGSRVFVDLTVEEKEARATIKNIANYEMNFSEDEILQRFVRGDEARSTEGSGLGLSIAQSFTQICGGRFSLKIDGDLFKVELCFHTV